MAKFNGLTLASNGALRALLAGTKTESDRNNAIAAVSHFLQGQPDGFGAHLTAIILAQAQSNQAHAERIEAAVRAFKEALPADEADGEELRAAQIQQLNKTLGGMKIALDPLPVHLSRAATSEQFSAGPCHRSANERSGPSPTRLEIGPGQRGRGIARQDERSR